jgi:CAAX protease family protein
MEVSAADRLFRAADGRMRLGWRLLLFVTTTLIVAAMVALLLPPVALAGSVALLVGAVAGGAVTLVVDDRPPSALGFYLARDAIGEAARGLALGVGVAAVVVAAIALFGGLRWVAEPGTPFDWVRGGVGGLLVLVVPAATEEALFRGYPLQALTEAWGPWWALGLMAGVFGLFHLRNPDVTAVAIVNIAIAGLFLGVIYLRTGSLWWATGAHLGWNWTHGYLADVPVSGLHLLNAPLYEGVLRGPRWLSGGGFGPEGSLAATVVLGVATLVCWRVRWLSPGKAALAARPLALVGGSRA